MERLTQRTNGVVVYVGAHNEETGGQIPCEVGPQGVREILARLAEYEDTGLTPEETILMRKDMAIIRAMFLHADADRLEALARADRDGRVVMLPCKALSAETGESGQMTLEQAIEHLENILRDHDFECESCKRDHRELLAFLVELRERRAWVAKYILPLQTI